MNIVSFTHVVLGSNILMVPIGLFARVSSLPCRIKICRVWQVLAITEDLHDVHSLGKEAAAVHRSLVEDLSKFYLFLVFKMINVSTLYDLLFMLITTFANAILFPLETVLSKDVAAMTDAICRERETKMEISLIHGQAIYQSYSLKIREACQTLDPLVPSLTSSVKGLYSMLTRPA
ncbi:hypothetical protein RchiOBHm_Chr6g0260221 [Rosa chinensis]|uniref:Uncharacterized protein n=1 Tax=Rosa chinensis TaxID=74649 RepID=A0A2P6PN25_ROSCH|nr:hypothetical protein RchiOBHm_Chr6g0260221 [Rosa chinensis]